MLNNVYRACYMQTDLKWEISGNRGLQFLPSTILLLLATNVNYIVFPSSDFLRCSIKQKQDLTITPKIQLLIAVSFVIKSTDLNCYFQLINEYYSNHMFSFYYSSILYFSNWRRKIKVMPKANLNKIKENRNCQKRSVF